MSGTNRYSIGHSNSYEKTLTGILKDHYKRDKKARGEFGELLGDLLTQLTIDPRAAGDQERWPKGTSREGWHFRKARFNMPGLRGKCRHGRLMYLIDSENYAVIPFIIYTHDEYGSQRMTRPPDKELKRMIEEHTPEESDN